MKARRQLEVRFIHAPCVKLTLSVGRPERGLWLPGRVLRIEKEGFESIFVAEGTTRHCLKFTHRPTRF